MDRTGANFFKVVDQMQTRLKAHPCPIVIPIGAEDQFQGVVDLIKMKGIIWDEASQGTKFNYIDIPADLVEQAKEWHEKMVRDGRRSERRADEQLPRKRRSLRSRHPQGHPRPYDRRRNPADVSAGSSFKNKGVQRMLDGVIEFLPSPVDIPPVPGFDLDDKEVHREATTTLRSRLSPSRS